GHRRGRRRAGRELRGPRPGEREACERAATGGVRPRFVAARLRVLGHAGAVSLARRAAVAVRADDQRFAMRPGAPRVVAFLRAINVGGHTVEMARLRQLFEKLGLADVETFIASGNVIFAAPKGSIPALEKRIAAHLEKSLGYEVATMLRTPAELAAVLGHNPFAKPVPGPTLD